MADAVAVDLIYDVLLAVGVEEAGGIDGAATAEGGMLVTGNCPNGDVEQRNILVLARESGRYRFVGAFGVVRCSSTDAVLRRSLGFGRVVENEFAIRLTGFSDAQDPVAQATYQLHNIRRPDVPAIAPCAHGRHRIVPVDHRPGLEVGGGRRGHMAPAAICGEGIELAAVLYEARIREIRTYDRTCGDGPFVQRSAIRKGKQKPIEESLAVHDAEQKTKALRNVHS